MDQRYGRRPRRRITGRFYAFITVLLIVVVGLGVFFNTRAQQSVAAYNYPTPQNQQQIAQVPEVQSQEPTPVPMQPVVQQKSVEQQPSEPVVETAQPSEEEMSGFNEVEDPTDEENLPEIEPVIPNELNARQDLAKEWRNFLLLGSDSRNMKKIGRCDTIMIASVNTETGEMRLASIMRDMMVEIPGHGMQKINATTYYGGPEMAMKVINENLGMNLTQYAVVNFIGLAEVINAMGGIYIDLTKDEMEEINRHYGAIAKYHMTKAEFKAQQDQLKVQTYGPNTLMNGYTAVTYARIRKLDSDYQRTERQRNVINGILNRVKDIDVGQIIGTLRAIFPSVSTNVGMMDASTLAMSILGTGLDMSNMKEWRMPGKDSFKSETRNGVSALYDVDYAYNRRNLHKFIYGTEFD
ncbi:LCP family protein [Eubacteriales bacterium OttesenSCG-928-N13]|nr:LCP family protein [Eubacteriales bacterium OttesenSCG-928-N13]